MAIVLPGCDSPTGRRWEIVGVRRPSALMFVLVVMALALGACGSGGDGGGEAELGPARRPVTKEAATGPFAFVHEAVCASAAAAAAGEAALAERGFDDAHAGLHDLAAAVEGQDRAVAADLLEAKQRVEAGGDGAARAQLASAVAAAIEATGGTAPEACPDADASRPPAAEE